MENSTLSKYLSKARKALPNCNGVRRLPNGELDAITGVGQGMLEFNVAANKQGPDHLHRVLKLEVAKTMIDLIRKEISCGEISESEARNLFHGVAAISIPFDEWIAIIDPYYVVGICLRLGGPWIPRCGTCGSRMSAIG